MEGRVHIDDLQIGGRIEQVVPVPRSGLEVELWSDPDPGDYVRVGQRVQFYFRTNADCYVTIVSLDSEGRARRIFPRRGDDGWVRGGRVHALPGRWDDYDFRFTGPAGEEVVFAVASLEPVAHRYPAWLSGGWGPRAWGAGWGDRDLYDTGWCFGDPVPQIYRFCERLVPYPHDYESYAATWIQFYVGYPRPPVWKVCRDCGGRLHHGHDCGRGYIEIAIGFGRGVCDFRRPCPPPRYRHVVCRKEEPRRWDRVFAEPRGRWRADDDDRHDGRDRHDTWVRYDDGRTGDRDEGDRKADGRDGWSRQDRQARIEERSAVRRGDDDGDQKSDRSRGTRAEASRERDRREGADRDRNVSETRKEKPVRSEPGKR